MLFVTFIFSQFDEVSQNMRTINQMLKKWGRIFYPMPNPPTTTSALWRGSAKASQSEAWVGRSPIV